MRLCVAFSWRSVRYLTRTNKRGVALRNRGSTWKTRFVHQRIPSTHASFSEMASGAVVRLVRRAHLISALPILGKRGGAKVLQNEGIPGSAHATNRPQRSQSIAHQYRSSAELSIVHSAAPGRDLCCALGNRESFGNRARQPKGCAADTAAGPA